MERRDRFLPPYISTRFTARLLTILLLLTAAVSGLSAGFEISQIHLLSGVGSYTEVNEETRWAHTFIRNTLLVSRLVLYGAIAVAFIAWLHRCRINVRAFGCRRFRYSRTWAINGFFVPILNFFRPYQVVSEVWRASDPRALETAKRAYDLDPNKPEVADTYGWIMLQNGKVQEGLSALQQAYVAYPTQSEIGFHVAVALSQADRKDESIKLLRRLLRESPGFPQAQDARALLEKLEQ